MDRASIHASISTSLQVAELPLLGQLLFERMFPHADLQGRLPGHPRKVKAMVIPMIDASAEEVAEHLQKMHELQLIVWYEVSGEKYIQLTSWWKFQRLRFAHPSKFPAPEGWKDRLRYNDPRNPKHLIEENWAAHASVGMPNKDAPEEAIPVSYTGCLHKQPTQGPYEGSEVHPSSSASASSSLGKNKKPSRPKSPPADKSPPSDPARSLAAHLAGLILSNNPDNRELRDSQREKTIERWALEIDRMIRIDKRTPGQIRKVVDWSQNDDFWKLNILSAKKLREQFDQLLLKSAQANVRAREDKDIEQGYEILRGKPQ